MAKSFRFRLTGAALFRVADRLVLIFIVAGYLVALGRFAGLPIAGILA